MANTCAAAIVLNVSLDVQHSLAYQRRYQGNLYNVQQADTVLESLVDKFDPMMVLEVLPRLMNHTIVSMMKVSDDGEGNVQYLHHSEKSLLGYCSFHHMLLEMCRRYPQIQKQIDKALEGFWRHESARVKLVQPDLGELLVYLSVSSKITWPQIAKVFLQGICSQSSL